MRLSFLLLLASVRPSSVLADQEVPRVLFGGPVSYAEAWDDERLWIVSRGRLLVLDLCDETPRAVRLAASDGRSRQRRPRDVEKELMLAGLDEGTWDDRVLEDFREDEGFSDEPRRRREGSGPPASQGVVRLLERRGEALAVESEGEEWLCVPDQAACKARLHAGTRAHQPAPPPLSDDLTTARASSHGRWLTNGQGVWFSPRDGFDRASVCVDLGRPFEPPSVAPFGATAPPRAWSWLPEVTLLGARRAVTWADGRRRGDVLLMILLSFPGGASPSLATPDDLRERSR